MSMNLHTTRTYKVEYGSCPVQGWSDIEKFLNFLREKSEDMDGIWISENEEDVEIDFDTLEELKDDETWGKVIQEIIDNSDKSNGYARLAIW